LVKSSWGLAHPMSLTELALLDGRRPLPLWDVTGLTLTLTSERVRDPNSTGIWVNTVCSSSLMGWI
jgi:hypothetical protein